MSTVGRISMAEYLAIPALSGGVIETLVHECPAKAWDGSTFNPERKPDEPTDTTDVGEVAHSILLEENEECVAVIDPQDHPAKTTGAIPTGWTNNSIRGARDLARLANKIPMLLHDMEQPRGMVKSAHRFIDSLKDTEPAVWAAFQDGDSELTLLWNDSGINCKARPDRMSRDRKVTIHVKTTTKSAAPEAFGRYQLLTQYYISAAWYEAAVRQCCGVENSAQLFLVIEQNPPYLCSLNGLSPALMEYARAMASDGFNEWVNCQRIGKFPAYPNRVCYYDLPGWKAAEWENQQVERGI